VQPGRPVLPRSPQRTLDTVFPEDSEAAARRPPQQAEHLFNHHDAFGFLPRHKPIGAVHVVRRDAVVHDGAADISWSLFQFDPDADALAVAAVGTLTPAHDERA
jgi:hypothetical protein